MQEDELFQFDELILPYRQVEYRTLRDRRGQGYLVWRRGTGGNVEILHFKAVPGGQGLGTELLRQMLTDLEKTPPYETIFGFCRVGNFSARKFYEKMGFMMTRVEGVYRDGAAYVFSQNYYRLKELHHAQSHG